LNARELVTQYHARQDESEQPQTRARARAKRTLTRLGHSIECLK
jgi:hypothetical protein